MPWPSVIFAIMRIIKKKPNVKKQPPNDDCLLANITSMRFRFEFKFNDNILTRNTSSHGNHGGG